MADRYWVGGTGTWGTTTTNWAATSDGAGGETAPTSADDVYFDVNSNTGTGAFTVTITGTVSCRNFTASGLDGTMTLARTSSTNVIQVYGSWLSPSTGFSCTQSMIVRFLATTTGQTISFGSTTTPAATFQFQGVGGEWTLTELFRTSNTITHSNGSLITNGYTVTAAIFTSSSGFTRSLTLGSSTIIVNGSGPEITFSATGLTLDAGTSLIQLPEDNSTFTCGGLTFYNLEIDGSSITSDSTIFLGSATFNNITIKAPTIVPGSRKMVVMGSESSAPGTITVNGAFTCSDSLDVKRRVMFGVRPATGFVHNSKGALVLNGTVSVTNTDFRNINVTGTAAPLTGTSIGNAAGCSGITFTSPKNCYLRGTAAVLEWHDNVWAATSGGANAIDNFPLPQDTVIVDDNTLITEFEFNDLNQCGGYCADFDASARTTTFLIDGDNSILVLSGDNGSLVLPSVITFTVAQGNVFCTSTDTVELDIAVSVTTLLITVNELTNVKLTNDLTITGLGTIDRSFTMLGGSLDLNGYTLTCSNYNLSTSTAAQSRAKSITFNGGRMIAAVPTKNVASPSLVSALRADQLTFTDGGYIEVVGTTANTASHPFSGTCSNMSLRFDCTIPNAALSGSSNFKNIDATDFVGSLTMATVYIYGDLITGASVTFPATSTNFIQFLGAGVNSVFSLAGSDPIPYNIYLTRLGGSVTLQSNIENDTTFFLRAGQLDLNGYTFTAGLVDLTETGNAVRSIDFTAGAFNIKGSGVTVLTHGYNNLSYVGTPLFTLTYTGGTGARTLSSTSSTEAGAPNVAFLGGTDSVSLGNYNSVDFTNFAGTLSSGARTIWGDLKISSGMTVATSTSATTFAKSSGTQTLTTAGKTFDFPVTKSGAGTLVLADDLTMGSTRVLTHTAGTLNDGGYNISARELTSSGATSRTLAFNGGTWSLSLAGVAFTASGSGLTTTGTGSVVSLTAATAKTFAGNGFDYSSMTLNQGGAGVLTVSGNNTFKDWSATTKPSQFTVTTGTTQTFQSFTLSGTAGNLVTIRNSSTVGANAHTFTKPSGTVNVDYLDIQRSNATGGAAWYAGANSTNSGTNTGWIFTAAPAVVKSGKFFQFFNWDFPDPEPLPPITEFWTPDLIATVGTIATTAAGPCNNYYRRRYITCSYTQAEMLAAVGTSTATIIGVAFDIVEQPAYQPLPDYAVGMKNGVFYGGPPGDTGNTVVKNPSSQSFTTGAEKQILFDTPFNWTGNDLGLLFAWGQSPTSFSLTGLTYYGSGSSYNDQSDVGGTFVINSSAYVYGGQRPVVRLLIAV